MIVNNETQKQLMELADSDNVYLEGNILKIIETTDGEFGSYINTAKSKDAESRKKRLDVTKQIQLKNKELEFAKSVNDNLMLDLKEALKKSEIAQKLAEDDLTIIQKKKQTELIGLIVKMALFIIVFVGVVSTILYVVAIEKGVDTVTLGNTWSNTFSILITNSFSILGTIMGVKYMQNKT